MEGGENVFETLCIGGHRPRPQQVTFLACSYGLDDTRRHSHGWFRRGRMGPLTCAETAVACGLDDARVYGGVGTGGVGGQRALPIS